MAEWKRTYHGPSRVPAAQRELTAWAYRTESLVVVVHHLEEYPADWFVSCADVRMFCESLETAAEDVAKDRAIELIRWRLAAWLAEATEGLATESVHWAQRKTASPRQLTGFDETFVRVMAKIRKPRKKGKGK